MRKRNKYKLTKKLLLFKNCNCYSPSPFIDPPFSNIQYLNDDHDVDGDFVVWLTDQRRLPLFPVGVIVTDPHHCEYSTNSQLKHAPLDYQHSVKLSPPFFYNWSTHYDYEHMSVHKIQTPPCIDLPNQTTTLS